MSVPPVAAPLVEMRRITKCFGKHKVLDDVSFELRAGEVHVLAGENGAGKSTFIKILAGIHTDFEGDILLSGKAVRPRSPLEANDLGIAVIHQELSLIGPISVADNIFLGRAMTRAGIVRDRAQRAEAARWLERLGLHIDPSRLVEQFSIATQQSIEIAKALSHQAKIIVMDEPTSALNEIEAERLFELVAQLKRDECGIIYITHKMEEIERIADRITVLRDGKHVATAPAVELPRRALIQSMVGRELNDQFPRHDARPSGLRLDLRNFNVWLRGLKAAAVQDATLSVRSGEIVGIGGLQGSGASELFLGMFGAYGNQTSGEMYVDGRKVRITSPGQAIAAGLALVTNDRKETGLVLPLSIVANIALASLPKLSVAGWRQPSAENRAAAALSETLRLRAASHQMPVDALSGGNQQKVVIAKWLETKPRVLLLDEPTRGIDVAAKREIYDLLQRLSDDGMAILMISSEMPELLALSDRVIVMHRGRIMTEMTRDDATPDAVLAAAMGDGAWETMDGAA
jgi:ABC-type sugar transport system ATPase subunit